MPIIIKMRTVLSFSPCLDKLWPRHSKHYIAYDAVSGLCRDMGHGDFDKPTAELPVNIKMLMALFSARCCFLSMPR